MTEKRVGLQPLRPLIGAPGSARADLGDHRVVPPYLYLPTREFEDGLRLAEVRELSDGRAALLAFTALDRLLDACGWRQPWAVVPLEGLETIRDEQPFDTVGFDVEVPSQLRRDGRLV